jgi:hypothetical protein
MREGHITGSVKGKSTGARRWTGETRANLVGINEQLLFREGGGFAAGFGDGGGGGGGIVHGEAEAADAVVGIESRGDGAGSGDASDFTYAFCAVAADFIGDFNEDDIHLRHFFGAEDAEIAQIERVRAAVSGVEIF